MEQPRRERSGEDEGGGSADGLRGAAEEANNKRATITWPLLRSDGRPRLQCCVLLRLPHAKKGVLELGKTQKGAPNQTARGLPGTCLARKG